MDDRDGVVWFGAVSTVEYCMKSGWWVHVWNSPVHAFEKYLVLPSNPSQSTQTPSTPHKPHPEMHVRPYLPYLLPPVQHHAALAAPSHRPATKRVQAASCRSVIGWQRLDQPRAHAGCTA